MKTRWCLLVSFLSLVLIVPQSHSAITGHWSFEAADMFFSARIGLPMESMDFDTDVNTRFGTTGAGDFAAVPHIGGQPVKILQFPKTPPPGGYIVPHGAAPNGGGSLINQYTIIMDVLFPSASSGKTRALFQTDLTPNAEYFINNLNQIGFEGGTFGGNITPDVWHRIVIAVDLAATSPSVAFYVDGTKVHEATTPFGIDGRLGINGGSLLFVNDDNDETESGYLFDMQFRDERMSEPLIVAMGGPTPEGILTGPPPNPYVIALLPSQETVRIPERSTVSPTPLIEALIVDGTRTVDPATVTMTLDGQPVVPTTTNDQGTNTIRYLVPTMLPSLSLHTVRIDYRDNTGAPYAVQWQFVVGRFVALTGAGPTGSASDPGFTVRTVQAPTDAQILNVNSFPRAIKQLNGTLVDTGGVVVANVAIPGPGAGGTYEADLINFHLTAGSFGNFENDLLFPGIPGTDGGTANFATEVITFLELTAGTHRLGVSVSVDRTDTGTDDGFNLYQGPDARNILSPVVGTFARNVSSPFISTFNNNEFTVVAPTDGVYSFRLVHYQTLQDANLEFYSVDASGTKILVNDLTESGAIRAYRVSSAPAVNKPQLVEINPAPGVSGVSPLAPIELLILDGATQVDTASIALFLNGVQVSPSSTTSGGRTRVFYQPNATRTEVTNRFRLVYRDNSAPSPVSFTNEWQFTIVADPFGASTVTGQWDFDLADLSATVGQPLQYFDGPGGRTANGTRFGTTTFFGIPDINGQSAGVMFVPDGTGPGANQIGYIMRHGIAANGGGTRVNQYTLIMDVYWLPPSGPNTFVSFVNFDMANTSDGDFFWDVGTGGMGQGVGGYAGNLAIQANRWQRLVFAVDMAANPPVVTKFIDGVKHADQLIPNNVLDGPRRSMPIEGAVLFGDGDQDERSACYVNSIQVRDGKLSDAEIAALGAASGDGVPAQIPANALAVKGQWDFNFATTAPNPLGPTVGQPLDYFDGPGGRTATGTRFGTTTSFGIPDINGQSAGVMFVPDGIGSGANQIGYIMRHGIAANGGGTRVNQYTLIMDLYWLPPTGGNTFVSFVNFDMANTSDGDFFWDVGTGGMGQGVGGYAGNLAIQANRWQRLVFAVDMAANPPVVTKFIDGVKHADQLVPNNVLDGARRSMPVEGAVLFADGDQDERSACYVSSIQVREGKLQDWEIAALGPVSARGIPVAIPQTSARAQWDFDFATTAPNPLGATFGQPLDYFDGPGGRTATGTRFGTTTSFSIPDIGGEPAGVMFVPDGVGAGANQIGYIMRHGIAANGGGTRVNQYTLIMDVYWLPPSGPNTFVSFVNFDMANTSDGDFFWDVGTSGFGQGVGGYAGNTQMQANRWHRVAFAVDMASSSPVVTKYLDGVKHADQLIPNNVLDGARRSMPVEGAVLFGDGDQDERSACYVSSVQVHNRKLSDAELAALGPATAAGIPVVLSVGEPVEARLTVTRTGTSIRVSWPAAASGTLEQSPSLTNPAWTPVEGVANNSATITFDGTARFFRLRP